MKTLVSIIMPAFNVGSYIGKSIESIINQEYQNWELIVVNDGSTDNTGEVVQAYSCRDSRIKLYEQENSGVSAARNCGMFHAAGEYLAFLDGDDLWDKRFLSEVVSAKEANHVDMAYTGYTSFYEDSRSKNFQFQYMDGDILIPYLKEITGMHIGSLLIAKSIVNDCNIHFTEGCPMGEDVEFIIKLLCVAKVCAVREELMFYRLRRPGSAMNTVFSWNMHMNVIKAFKRAQQFVQKNCLEYVKCSEIVDILNSKIGQCRYWILWKMVKNGYHEDARRMLADPECILDLQKISKSALIFKQRLRYHAIMSQNKYLWNCCALFKAR
ncbi:glycosyltransferase family 2 protein [Anaerospora sp.]|uniref:glycosyltransferase family 2 protein n=1 Tax=Anaerospora sp. TaxID=1960278 RepID=UPI00289CCB8B|nr:glycosyltransferase family 2 protein [Anaerospora sp.]